jgi:hypothetical protein
MAMPHYDRVSEMIAMGAVMKQKKPQSKKRSKPQAGDKVTSAAEEGDPQESGRSHGRIIGKDGAPVTQRDQDTTDEHWESGRQEAD